nr:unnamed protein product [Callosobruchus analis]
MRSNKQDPSGVGRSKKCARRTLFSLDVCLFLVLFTFGARTHTLKIMSDWDHDKIVKLVGMYETKPELWDPTNTFYHMRNKKLMPGPKSPKD